MIDGRLHHFTNAGLYDGLFTLYDAETHTLWNHLTGEAEYGPMVGRTLGPPGNQLQMNVKQALEEDPKTEIAISDRVYFAGGKQFGTAGGIGPGRGGGQGRGGPNPDAVMTDRFRGTLGKEDQRHPRMELGLGVWTAAARRYYPVARIREHGGAFIDRLDGRAVLIYIDQESNGRNGNNNRNRISQLADATTTHTHRARRGGGPQTDQRWTPQLGIIPLSKSKPLLSKLGSSRRGRARRS